MSEQEARHRPQDQPYDTSFKALLDDQMIEMLSFLFGEEIKEAHELKESLFKQETVKPALRVDCAYRMVSRGRERAGPYVGHTEFETTPTKDIDARMLEYFSLLRHKYELPIRQVLLCPFETPNLPTQLHRIDYDGEWLVKHRYRVVALWKYQAPQFLENRRFELYAMLPAMSGATYEVLAQGIQEMQEYYTGYESRLRTHLLWFDTFLGRTTTVTSEDKGRIREVMNNFRSLLDESPFVQERVAEGEARGEARGRAAGLTEGEARGLHEALLTAVEIRFPSIIELVDEKVRRINKLETLRFLLNAIKKAPNEEVARFLLDVTPTEQDI